MFQMKKNGQVKIRRTKIRTKIRRTKIRRTKIRRTKIRRTKCFWNLSTEQRPHLLSWNLFLNLKYEKIH